MSDFWARRLCFKVFEESSLIQSEVKLEVNRDSFIKLIKDVPAYH
jgi:hypothetical protein